MQLRPAAGTDSLEARPLSICCCEHETAVARVSEKAVAAAARSRSVTIFVALCSWVLPRTMSFAGSLVGPATTRDTELAERTRTPIKMQMRLILMIKRVRASRPRVAAAWRCVYKYPRPRTTGRSPSLDQPPPVYHRRPISLPPPHSSHSPSPSPSQSHSHPR